MLAELKNQNSKPFIIKEPKTIKKKKKHDNKAENSVPK